MKNFTEKVQENGPAGRKRSDRKGNRTRQRNKRGDSKVESNDSPETQDRGETSDVPGLPSGDLHMRECSKYNLLFMEHTANINQAKHQRKRLR